MRATAFLACTAALAGFSAAVPLSERDCEYAVKEYHPVPKYFQRVGDAPRNHRIQLSVGLKQGSFEELERHLWEVSDPDHHRYGQHLSQSEVNELVRPSDESSELVREWLHQHVDPEDIESSSAGDFLTFTLPVEAIERMLNTKYSTYEHADGFRLVRTPEWSLPVHLHDHISTIQPTNAFMRPYAQAKTVRAVPGTKGIEVAPLTFPEGYTPTVADVCNTSSVTPRCLRTLYGTIDYRTKAGTKNQIAINDFLNEINNRSDAALFLETFRPNIVQAAYEFKQISVDGGTTQQTPETHKQLKEGIGLEGNLDIQTVLGITYPENVTIYSTKGLAPFIPDSLETTSGNEPYMKWLNYILAQSDIPFQVISNSYDDDEDTVPPSYAKSVCAGFAQLGARGVSIFFGSGDAGVEGVQAGGNCTLNTDPNKKVFVPTFPASCPYVTTVAATVNFTTQAVAYDPANGFYSGGGFSNYFGRPSWQDKAVESFLKQFGNKYSKYYNQSGRAYPDVAAYGVNFTIAWDGQLLNLDGTSAATPTVASVISLLNDARIAAGKSSMGWLNPFIYKYGSQAFSDITHGSTVGCNTTGFPALPGWDAGSGWGSPIFSELRKAAGV